MLVSNNEKTFVCVNFYTVDKKLRRYENGFGEKSKNRDKLIQSVPLGQHTKNRDSWNICYFASCNYISKKFLDYRRYKVA